MLVLNTIKKILLAVLGYLQADWYILLIGISIVIGIKVYLGSERLNSWMNRRASTSIIGIIGFGAFTPLCACGTMAVIITMFVTSLPWGSVMAFLVSSPLTSPSQFFLQAGILGTDFAFVILISSVLLGLGAGFVANYLEKKTDFFEGQFRLKDVESISCCGASQEEVEGSKVKNPSCYGSFKPTHKTISEIASCCDSSAENQVDYVDREGWFRRWKIDQVLKEFYLLGVKRILIYFTLFIALGQLVEMFVPTEIILKLFSPDKFYSIPLAAVIGLPIYVSGISSLPLLETFMNAGAGSGAALAFLIAGQGTSVAVIAGISTFLKRRAILFYVTFVLLGAIFVGWIYQLIFPFVS